MTQEIIHGKFICAGPLWTGFNRQREERHSHEGNDEDRLEGGQAQGRWSPEHQGPPMLHLDLDITVNNGGLAVASKKGTDSVDDLMMIQTFTLTPWGIMDRFGNEPEQHGQGKGSGEGDGYNGLGSCPIDSMSTSSANSGRLIR